ncbi:phage holin family protein [Gloeobacter kilaueensis]|uniref:Phage holin family protein n=1 Tax=Gloeobacter kilaueensis (strain ATCC BAA-2537 / CCAP 1431/1 / ULC 316 / JS1) TaxID=1183438 RepID=U5QL12_GLOK1|nr:phage holin family protein [Gloeobacter kilaueensis]AGY58335.1 hypothetical protein GKIL_2089 [Gloeobacter kilaueensis JS1]
MQRYTETNVGSLLSQLIAQMEQLLAAHLRLAYQEMVSDGKQFAVQSVGIAAGGILAILGLAFIGVTLMHALEIWLAPWLASLIVAVVFLGGGGLLALLSLRRIQNIEPAIRTREETQETIAWLTRKQ